MSKVLNFEGESSATSEAYQSCDIVSNLILTAARVGSVCYFRILMIQEHLLKLFCLTIHEESNQLRNVPINTRLSLIDYCQGGNLLEHVNHPQVTRSKTS